MPNDEMDSLEEQLIPVKGIKTEITRRLSPYVYETVAPQMVSEYEEAGWSVDRRLKVKIKLKKEKTHDVAFEDLVWATMAKLNFTALNKSRTFRIPYGNSPNESQQIDVFAADDEVVLVVECKSSTELSQSAFKKDIEAIQGYRDGLIKTIKKSYPAHKIKFILATNNFSLSDDTKLRIKNANVVYMDEDTIKYYGSLAEHLGKSARYQLLGNLFAGTKIPGIDSKVPALQGKMGGHVYYSFAIEPARLLKFSYVLHRNMANSLLMPTYQRLIKKSRLKKVAQFVDDGGYFPNSIILNIDGGSRGPRFELSSTQYGESKLGILHLPQTYRSAFVIDGQHRLYGFANSPRAETELIPVVAFVNLEPNEQVELFMKINENQQAVPKNLRNTLNSDLLWESDDYRDRVKALKLKIAQNLGDSKFSALYDRVLIGENARTPIRCITIEAINNGLNASNFFGKFTKSQMKIAGTFYRGGNDATFQVVAPFLDECLDYLKNGLLTQWKLGSKDGGFVFINPGVESLIRVLSDIVDHLVKNGIEPAEMSPQELASYCTVYLDPLIAYLSTLDADAGLELRRQYGSGGATKYWRRLQTAINAADSDFSPPGFDEYQLDLEKRFNTESFEMIRALEQFMKEDVRNSLVAKYGEKWFKSGVPIPIQKKATELAIDKNQTRDIEDEVTPWDCLYLGDYHGILTASNSVWQEIFMKKYTRPGDEDRSGKWTSRLDWLQELGRIRNQNVHEYSVTEDEFNFLVTLTSWLIQGEDKNSL
jgi:DNA sulfur modification protein DndB